MHGRPAFRHHVGSGGLGGHWRDRRSRRRRGAGGDRPRQCEAGGWAGAAGAHRAMHSKGVGFAAAGVLAEARPPRPERRLLPRPHRADTGGGGPEPHGVGRRLGGGARLPSLGRGAEPDREAAAGRPAIAAPKQHRRHKRHGPSCGRGGSRRRRLGAGRRLRLHAARRRRGRPEGGAIRRQRHGVSGVDGGEAVASARADCGGGARAAGSHARGCHEGGRLASAEQPMV
mmetsp:Transcript_122754/g.354841  ORF Transcript_122754/g.354841 Transcript_122754/m.354841 type:complete len:229 (+) Transcript_122754:169-855(+)